MSKIITSLQDSWEEFAVKATWPSLSELQKSTTLVLIGTIIFSLVVFGMDKVISTVLEFIYSIFG
ncbi:MAG TPA: preprotein translocase subunit SecE [Cryomorphaceae bacterium]|jgi:preprotein translocase subunit SecE|nr:preprotein translocase subunit SecE [Schleiferiaceae bacterium]HAK70137.1 preprotein translocase subunit SecE [Cryomorphaceae bacterium]HBB80679.1 preprotein translocase subunit SecE [Cryomorphaceae bacterium]HCY25990.1 preprotein translocase subunit SecE [Cryomorphaceae bacterium]